LVIGLAAPACGHNVVVFATADGKMIHGEAFFRGGSPIRDAKILVKDASGTALGETITDEKGEFEFEAIYRCDHRFVADAGSGHRGEYVVPADELPDDLPSRDADTQTPQLPEGGVKTSLSKQSSSDSLGGSVDTKLDALARQVRELRRQLNRHDENRRFQDIIGGIGYIVGASGLAFYFLGVRRRKSASAVSVSPVSSSGQREGKAPAEPRMEPTPQDPARQEPRPPA
jgi:hypothetical protein